MEPVNTELQYGTLLLSSYLAETSSRKKSINLDFLQIWKEKVRKIAISNNFLGSVQQM